MQECDCILKENFIHNYPVHSTQFATILSSSSDLYTSEIFRKRRPFQGIVSSFTGSNDGSRSGSDKKGDVENCYDTFAQHPDVPITPLNTLIFNLLPPPPLNQSQPCNCYAQIWRRQHVVVAPTTQRNKDANMGQHTCKQ